MMPTTENLIVHICAKKDWQKSLQQGQYRHPSLAVEGFIHCSRPDQILQVANHYYPGEHDLLLLWIDPRRLSAELRWDPVGETNFPHVYGPLNLEAVQSVTEFPPDKDGVFRNLKTPA